MAVWPPIPCSERSRTAPTPCTARQDTSQVMDVDRAHINDAPTKMPAPIWKTSLRPNRSPNLPARTVAIVSVIR